MANLKVTKEAKELIEFLKKEYKEILFNISGGCCDGTSAMCYQKGDFIVPLRNVHLGKILDCDVFIDKEQYKYFKSYDIIIDAQKTLSHGNSFSLEVEHGYSFVVNSSLCKNLEFSKFCVIG
ncbi:MAG: UDP-glucose 4-epimerase [Deltaproteobacteria bacterium]|nr:MAG: UDP-glucose 4-epimerase [Deltaproteobacteria bacterium]